MKTRATLALLAAGLLSLAAGRPAPVRPDAAAPLFDDSPHAPYDGMVSNSISQMRLVVDGSDTLLFAANSFGVMRSADLGRSFVTFTDSCGVGRGGVCGLAATAGLLAAATVVDTSIADVQGAGTGIGFSQDHGVTWTWLPQPLDAVIDTTIDPHDWVPYDCETGEPLDWQMAVANRTPVENISWGLAIEGDSALWAASFAGGFRRYSLATQCWRLYVPDHNRFDPAQDYNLNHRAFSVLASRDGLWAGSAGGVNFLAWDSLRAPGTNVLGDGWRHFDFQHPQLDGTPTITGNWVVTMEQNLLPDGSDEVWVAGWATYASVGDYYGLSWTGDNGASWTEIEDLRGVKIWDLAFDGEDVWVASDEGLWKSNRHGEAGSWSNYGVITDAASGHTMLTPTVYAVKAIGGQLLVGTPSGLFRSDDRGNTWTSTTHEPSGPLFFPNPFSPRVHGAATLAVKAERAGGVTIRIYDFAMDLVKTVADGAAVPAGQRIEFHWDGTNRRGDQAANGVYFYSVEGPGISSWGKLMVVK